MARKYCFREEEKSPTNSDLGLSSLLSSMKAHRRAKAQQAYPSSKQAQAHARQEGSHCHGSPFLTPPYSL